VSDIRWCCAGFNANFLTAGERGVGVFAAMPPGHERPMFFLQFRALDADAPPPRDGEAFTAAVQLGLRFCPWCGRNLRKWYLRSIPLLRRDDLFLSG